jgi:mono/diheme cytochrome c family protein
MKRFVFFVTGTFLALAVLSATSFAQSEKEDKGLDGRKIFVEKKCNSCHSVEAVGFKKKPNQNPPDLSAVGSEHNADWLSKYLQKKEAIEGRKHLVKFQGSDEDLVSLTKWLETLKPDSTKAER